jgi:hypothetical protein|tara:strand:+ start:260 stop:568 length:309 start_codon:yes stop_codon:yes gene_type:complete
MEMHLPRDVEKDVENLAKSVAKNKMAAKIDIMKHPKKDQRDGEEGKYDRLSNDISGLLDSWDDRDHPYYKDLQRLLDDKKDIKHEEEDYDEDHDDEHDEEDY